MEMTSEVKSWDEDDLKIVATDESHLHAENFDYSENNIDTKNDFQADLKWLENASLWDLLLQKVKNKGLTTSEALEIIFSETEVIITQIKKLIDLCLQPDLTNYEVHSSRGRKIKVKSEGDNGLSLCLGDQLTKAIGHGRWNLKEDFMGDFDLERLGLTTNEVKYDDLDPEYEHVELMKKKVKVTKSQKKMSVVKKSKGRPPLPELPKMLFHRVEGRYYCDFPGCQLSNQPFEQKLDFERHYSDTHLTMDDLVLKCLFCDEKFATYALREAHMEEKHEKPFSCPHCQKKFWTQRNLNIHLIKAQCGKENKEVSEDSKVKEESSDDKEETQCTKCGKKLASRRWAAKHEAKCDGFFVRHAEWKRVGDEYFCAVPGCTIGHGFSCMYGLRGHFHSTHITETEKIFACEHCDEKFSYKTSYNKHVREAHLKNFPCDLCGRKFGTKDKLKNHRMTHTGDKPYACDKCDYKTIKKYNLDTHKQAKHTDFGQKSFYCQLCGKPFSTAGRMTRHIELMHQPGNEKKIRGLKKIQQHHKMMFVQQQQQQQQQQHQILIQQPLNQPVELIATEDGNFAAIGAGAGQIIAVVGVKPEQ